MNKITRKLSLTFFLLACVSAFPAFAQVYLNIGIAPPALQYEVLPNIPRGYVWVPGHWVFHNDRYVWIRGRTVVQRVGYVWAPDRWEQRDQFYYRNPGHWQRDVQDMPVQPRYVRPQLHRDNGNHFGQVRNDDRGNHGYKKKHDKREKHDKHSKHGKHGKD